MHAAAGECADETNRKHCWEWKGKAGDEKKQKRRTGRKAARQGRVQELRSSSAMMNVQIYNIHRWPGWVGSCGKQAEVDGSRPSGKTTQEIPATLKTGLASHPIFTAIPIWNHSNPRLYNARHTDGDATDDGVFAFAMSRPWPVAGTRVPLG
jgi:hypothetical protein